MGNDPERNAAWYARVKQDPEYMARRRKQNREFMQRKRRKELGMSEEDYATQVVNGCFICRKIDVRLVIDHCHVSGKVRGILCSNCNTALGLMHDDVDNIGMAMEYLHMHGAGL